MVKRGMLLSETNGCALLEVDGRHYLLPMEASLQSNGASRAGLLVNVTFDANGIPERAEPVPPAPFKNNSSPTERKIR